MMKNITDISNKFIGKYRIPSTRIKNYNYATNGAYFVTICTHHRQHFFGEIVEGAQHFTNMGETAKEYWEKIPNYFQQASLGEWIVMPNHVHGILFIEASSCYNLSTMVRWYKGRTTFETRKQNPDFAWQPGFYEHVIRNEQAFEQISEYIINNPKQWEIDEYGKKKL